MTEKLTSLPWKISDVIDLDGMFFIYIKTKATHKNWLKNDAQRIIARVEGIAEEQTESEVIATAEFIVRAVNNHDALVEALQWLYGMCLKEQLVPDTVSYMKVAEQALARAGVKSFTNNSIKRKKRK